MKTKTTITELTNDDLVNLLSTATCGSNWLSVKRPKGSYKGTKLEDENDCLEDTWAKVLLAGKSVYVYDFYAEDEDEHYGELPCTYKDNAMRYEVTLADIMVGLQKCLDGTFKVNDDHEVFYMKTCVANFADVDGVMFDLNDAENIMQVIVFNELIYG